MGRLVSKSKFKPRSLEYFRQIEKSGEELIITDRGQPVLKILRYSHDPAEVLKTLRNTALKYEKATDPVGAEEWESLK